MDASSSAQATGAHRIPQRGRRGARARSKCRTASSSAMRACCRLAVNWGLIGLSVQATPGATLPMMRWPAGAFRRYAAARGDENIDYVVIRQDRADGGQDVARATAGSDLPSRLLWLSAGEIGAGGDRRHQTPLLRLRLGGGVRHPRAVR